MFQHGETQTDTLSSYQRLYNRLKENPQIKLPDYDYFESRLKTEDGRKKFHSLLSGNKSVRLPDYDTFTSYLGPIGTPDPQLEAIKEVGNAVGESMNKADAALKDLQADVMGEEKPVGVWEGLKRFTPEAWKGVARGFVGIPQALQENLAALNEALPGIVPRGGLGYVEPEQVTESMRSGADYLESVKQNDAIRQDEQFADFEISDVINDPGKAIGWLGGTSGESIPQMLAAMAASGASGGGTWAPIIASYLVNQPLMTGQQLGEARRTREAKGEEFTDGDKLIALGIGTLAAGAESWADVGMFKGIFGKLKKSIDASGLDDVAKEAMKKEIAEGLAGTLSQIGKETAKQLPKESGTEMVQTVIENVGAKFGWDPDRDIMQGVPESGFAGAGFTAQMGGMRGAFEMGKAGVKSVQERRARANQIPDELLALEGENEPQVNTIDQERAQAIDAWFESLDDADAEKAFTLMQEMETEQDETRLESLSNELLAMGMPNKVQGVRSKEQGVGRNEKGEMRNEELDSGVAVGSDNMTGQEGVQAVETDDTNVSLEKDKGLESKFESGSETDVTPTFGTDEIAIDPLETGGYEVYERKNGKTVRPRSKQYAEVVGPFIQTEFADAERVSDDPNLEEADYVERVLSESTNPLEIIDVYQEGKEANTTVVDLSDPKQAIADFLKTKKMHPDDFARYGNPGMLRGSGIRMQYLSSEASKDADTWPRQIAEAYPGVSVELDDIIDFMAEYDGGAQSYFNSLETDVPQRAKNRFKEVMGLELTDELADRIKGVGSKEQGVNEKGEMRNEKLGDASPFVRNDVDFMDDGEVPFQKGVGSKEQGVGRNEKGEMRNEKTAAIVTELKALVKDWANANAVVLVDSDEAISDHPLLKAAMDREPDGGASINGAFINGKAYVLVHRAASLEAAKKTLFHEMIGHFGVRGLANEIGMNTDEGRKQLNRLLDDMYEAFKDDPRFTELADLYGYDLSKQADQRKTADEFFAKLSETDVPDSLWTKIVQFMRDIARKAGLTVRLNEADVKQLIANAKQLVENGYVVLTDNAVVAQRFKAVQFEKGVKKNEKGEGRSEKLLAPNGKPSKLTPTQYKQVRTSEFKKWFGDWENDPKNASKVVDENGEPLVVYHGTVQDFSRFDTTKRSDSYNNQNAIFTSNNPDVASTYTRADRVLTQLEQERDQLDATKNDYTSRYKALSEKIKERETYLEKNANGGKWFMEGGNIASLFVKAINPLIVDAKGNAWFNITGKTPNKSIHDLIKEAKTKGHDGVIVKNVLDFGKTESKEERADLEKNPSTDVIAFTSNQVKSATGNTGDFDENNEDIRFQRSPLAKKVEEAFTQGRSLVGFLKENLDLDPVEVRRIWKGLKDRIGSRATELMQEGDARDTRSDLASVTGNEAVNDAIRQTDTVRTEQSIPERQKQADLLARAKQLIEADKEAVKQNLIETYTSENPNWNALQVIQARLLIEQEGIEAMQAVKDGDYSKMHELSVLVDGYRRVGTETARALAARKGTILNPDEQFDEYVKQVVEGVEGTLADAEQFNQLLKELKAVQQEALDNALESEEWKRRAKELQAIIDELQGREQALLDELDAVSDELKRLESAKPAEVEPEIIKKIEKTEKKLEQTEQDLKDKTNKERKLLGEISRLKQDLEKAQNNPDPELLRTYTEPLRNKIKDLEAELEKMRKEREAMKAEQNRMRKEIRRLKTELNAWKSNPTTEGMKNLIDLLQDQVKQLQGELDAIKDGRIELTERKDKKEETDDERAIRLLSDRIKNSFKEKSGETKGRDPVMMMVDSLYGIIQNQIRKKNAKLKTPSKVELIQDAIRRKVQYREIWEAAKVEVLEKLGDNPEALVILQEYFGTVPFLNFSEARMEGAIRAELKRMDVDLNELVKQHFRDIHETKMALIDVFIADGGLSLAEADEMARIIETQLRRLIQKKRLGMLKQKLTKKDARKQSSFEQRVSDIISLGALDGLDTRQALAELMGLVSLSGEQSAELKRLNDAIQLAKTEEAKNEAYANLLDFILTERIRGENMPLTVVNELSKQIDRINQLRNRKKDAVQSARNRRVFTVMQALLTMPKQWQQELDKATTPEAKEAILQAYKTRLDAIREGLLNRTGIDMYNLSDAELDDRRVLAQIVRSMAAANATRGDKLYEYWMNSILSGLGTQQINVIGNTANTIWTLTAKRFTEATLNLMAQDGDSAQFGELPSLYASWFKSFPKAFENALLAWDIEDGVLSDVINRVEPLKKFVEFKGGQAIGGKLGRLIRVPLRGLLFVDELMKTMNYQAQLGALAYRRAKSEGLKGQRLQSRIEELMQSPTDDMVDDAYDFAVKLAFQENRDGKMRRWIQQGRNTIPGGKFILPFVNTPANILAQGVKATPLGSLRMVYKGVRSLLDSDYEYSKAEILQDAAEQVLSFGVLMMILPLVGSDDEDELPWITGSTPYTSAAKAEFKGQNLPQTSIRIGKTWYNYGRIEPVGTMMAITVNALESFKQSVDNGLEPETALLDFVNKVQAFVFDKSYLRSIGDFMRIASGDQTNVLTATQSFATNFITGWVPNVVRQPMRNSDDLTRNYKQFEQGFVPYSLEYLKRLGQKSAPVATFAPMPKVDFLGRDIEKSGMDSPQSDFWYRMLIPMNRVDISGRTSVDRLITNWNLQHPDDEWYPTIPKPEFTMDGKTYILNEKQYHRFMKMRGELAREILVDRTDILNYADKPEKRYIELIKSALEAAGNEAKARLLQNEQLQLKEK